MIESRCEFLEGAVSLQLTPGPCGTSERPASEHVDTTANLLAERSLSRAVSLRWIISARDDLVWFIGSVVSRYALFFLFLTGIVPLVPLVAGWAILFEAPHWFGP